MNFSLIIFKEFFLFYKILGLQIISWDLDLGFRNKEKYFRAPGVHNLLLMRLNLNKLSYKNIYSSVNYYLLINIIVTNLFLFNLYRPVSYIMSKDLKDIRKEQIMNAAQAVVVSKGYDQSRMDDIVAKAQLSKGAIYWYYKSKKDVYLSLIDYWFNEYSEGIFNCLEDKQSSSDKLRALFEYFVDQFDKNPDTFKIMVEFLENFWTRL